MRRSPEKEQERERVRMTLMRATLELAEVHGFSGLGLREISRQAGIAPTSFYRHFADVEELGLGIIARLVGPWLSRVAAEANTATAEGGDPVASVVSGMLDGGLEDPPLVRFVLSQHSGAHASFRRELRAQFEPLRTALGPCLPPGAPQRVTATALVGILLACDQLLEAEPDERSALRTKLGPPVAAATRWLLRAPGEGEGDDG